MRQTVRGAWELFRLAYRISPSKLLLSLALTLLGRLV